MKLNNFTTFLLLLCFTLGPCTCTGHNLPNDNTIPQTAQAFPPNPAPGSSFPFPPSKSPHTKTPIDEDDITYGGGGGSSHSYTSFSAAFADILKGTFRGNTMPIPDNIDDDKTNPPNNNRQALRRICAHTDYPDVCFTTITPFVHRHHFDVMKVLEAGIMACSYQTNFTITKVVKHMSSSPELASALSECKEQYTDALDNLHRAIDAIPSRDLGTITVRLSAVMADVSACESGFEDIKATSNMGYSEGMVSITASNCLAIASLIPY